MSKSRARLAADWFAKLRVNETTQAVEHEDVATVEAEVTAVAANTTFTTLTIGDWVVSDGGGILYFSQGGVAKAKIDASGNLTAVSNVTAYGSV